MLEGTESFQVDAEDHWVQMYVLRTGLRELSGRLDIRQYISQQPRTCCWFGGGVRFVHTRRYLEFRFALR